MNNTEAINEFTEWAMVEYITYMNFKNENASICRHNESIDLDLPIDSIDGVKVHNVRLEIYSYVMRSIIVLENCEYSSNIENYTPNRFETHFSNTTSDKSKEVCLSKEGIREGFVRLFDYISKLGYDNFNGHFTTFKKQTLPYKAMCHLASLGKSKTSGNMECCVCYEATKTHFSKCKHSVCGRCISNMSSRNLQCPMCRAKIYTENDDDE
jgi:hypothetical protein